MLDGLEQLGYAGVDSVRAGKVITLVVRADSEDAAREAVQHMGDQLLANPVIETFTVEVAPADQGA
jgi:phosphoribosylformylglycinamidine synthase